MSKNIIKFDESFDTCPSCSNYKVTIFSKKHHNSIELKYFICKKCWLIFMNPRPSDKEYEIFYRKKYRIFSQKNINPNYYEFLKQYSRAKVFYKIIENYNFKPNSHLDIGSSTGAFLRALNDTMPSIKISDGLELDEKYRKFSQKFTNTTYITHENLLNSKKKYDLITMLHVFEHINYPKTLLDIIKNKLLSKRGKLYIEVPNFMGNYGGFELGHPYVYMPKSIKYVLNLSGFEIEKLITHGNPKNFGPRAKNYISILAKPSNDITIVNDTIMNIYLLKLIAWKNSKQEKLVIFILKLPIRIWKNLFTK